ncbi:protein TIC 20-IV, chloroplastic-like isoform X1 [Cucurbita maxima]|uniref:Protein TIC 20 n=1 Tax=Cucurbita maxima TaxID=3661 RepID=A0A6J1HZ71_CUCMA|nr:protein TIC 20-IV, chloroplastic-like isoform X1 [Cucurbita maxima]
MPSITALSTASLFLFCAETGKIGNIGKMFAVAPSSSARLRCNSPNPLLSMPATMMATASSVRYRDVVLKGCFKPSQVVVPQCRRLGCANLGPNLVLFISNTKQEPCKELKFSSSRGMVISHLSAAASPTLCGEQGSLFHKLPLLPPRKYARKSPQAFRDDSYGVKRHSMITKKPEWWWRTLACVPYLMALQMSSTAYYLLPLLEHLNVDNLIFYVPGAVQNLPWWFPMLYVNLAYFGVVRNKELPHFIRFHVMMGMLLGTALDILWYTSNFMPLIHYNGTYSMQYWAAVGFIYISILSLCIRSSLIGTYAKIPFISENALIHTFFSTGRYFRPF